MYVLYFLIAIGATTIGAITGMGGGVFIKPILDILGDFDVGSISMLSAITVFCMAMVSAARQQGNGHGPERAVAVPLALGSVLGGNLGGVLLRRLIAGASGAAVTRVQNIVLAGLILLVMAYMVKKDIIRSPELKGSLPALLVGVFLGFCSSFLGIGGGPINVALIILLFNYSTKKAALCSLITIFFSQGAKLAQAALTGGFGAYDLRMAPLMVAGAVAGGLLGAHLAKRLDGSGTDKLFQAAQVLILIICVVNIIRSGR